MRNASTAAVIVALFALVLAAPASAAEVCLGLSNGDNVYQFEATIVGGYVQLTGRDRTFPDRPVSGSLAIIPGGVAAAVAFTSITSLPSVVSFHAVISFLTLSGTYNLLIQTAGGAEAATGTMSVVSCTPPPDAPADGPRDVTQQ
jgi:hypothetical protein